MDIHVHLHPHADVHIHSHSHADIHIHPHSHADPYADSFDGLGVADGDGHARLHRKQSGGYSHADAHFHPRPDVHPDRPPTPTPLATYRNSPAEVAAALGCSEAHVLEVRTFHLQPDVAYLILRLTALCGGCTSGDVLALRADRGWDEIVAFFGYDWFSFTADVRSRIQVLRPEPFTPTMVFRTAANDPSAFPAEEPASVSGTVLFLPGPSREVCP